MQSIYRWDQSIKFRGTLSWLIGSCLFPQVLHQCTEEHKTSVIGKHIKEFHGVTSPDLTKMFSMLKKCQGKLDCLVNEMLLITPTLNSCLVNEMLLMPTLNSRSQTQYVRKHLFNLMQHAPTL